MNSYQYHIGDFDRATRHLTRIERSIYRDLIDVYMETEQPISLDLAKVKRKILANTEQESTAVEQVLNEFFTETPTGWFHSRCDEEILHYRSNNSQKALAGKASAAAKALRKQQALNGNSTDVTTPVEQTNNGISTNHKPITNNHKPKKKEKEAQALTVPFDLPDWINKNLWDAWHRTVKRKNANAEQKQIAVNKLTRWRDAGLDFAKALEDAADGGWQGLHEPKAPMKPSGSIEPAWRREQRERTESAVPGIAAKTTFNKQFIDVEATNVTAIALGR